MTEKCRHCRKKRICRSRRLCWTCFHTNAIKSLYPLSGNHANKGLGRAGTFRKLPPEPTLAIPGTEHKIRVMQERIAANCDLFHPDDLMLVG